MLDREAQPDGLPHVITTWHTGEPVDEVLSFALHCTYFEPIDFFRDFLILIIGQDPNQRKKVRSLFERALADPNA